MPLLEHPLQRAVVLGLAVVGLFWLFVQASSPSETRISGWRGAPAAAQPSALAGVAAPLSGRGRSADSDRPAGNPLQSPRTMMTQGYGVGTHAPAATWGAIDLAIDGDGDGIAGSIADVSASQGSPIYATHRGVVTVTPNSVPAGNHVWVTNDSYRTGYSHLSGFAVESGQMVERGTLIGYMGSTGMSSGPHLDYQIWLKQDGRWVNQNPLDFGPYN
jgi:murein DD-endopeptidase MepM/ murein hydrolase activator NlpD